MADNLLNSLFKLFIDLKTEAPVSQRGDGLGLYRECVCVCVSTQFPIRLNIV